MKTKKRCKLFSCQKPLRAKGFCNNRCEEVYYKAMAHSRNSYIKSTYGIDQKTYQEIFDSQKGCCAICGLHQINFKRRLAIDHNHQTNEIRGLLCHNCNTGIGQFKDSPDLLQKAIEYLKK